MKDIRYYLNREKEYGREGFMWLCIEEGLGLKFGVNEKYRLIWELEGIEFQQFRDLWKTTRDYCYRYHSGENKRIAESKKQDEMVHRFYGGSKNLNV